MGTANTGAISQRRALSFASFDEVLSDLSALQTAHQVDSIATIGNWTPGEIFDHLAKLFEYSIDGFPFTAPLPMRLFGRLLKPLALNRRDIPAGLKLRGSSAVLLPEGGTSFETGMERLQKQIARVQSGERMARPSPIFGAMSHAQWMSLQLKHCVLHLSFLLPGDTP